MNFLINPNIAYLFVVGAVMLANMSLLFPRSSLSKIGTLVCLAGAAFELFNFPANPWALVVLAFSPLSYFMAIRPATPLRPLLIITAGMFVFGSWFLLVDEKGSPVVNSGLLFLVSVICAQFIWVFTERQLSPQGTRRNSNSDSLIGLVGTAITQVEDVGLVEIEGETCPARSDHPISSGSIIRVLKYEGRVLVVKKVEKLNQK